MQRVLSDCLRLTVVSDVKSLVLLFNLFVLSFKKKKKSVEIEKRDNTTGESASSVFVVASVL